MIFLFSHYVTHLFIVLQNLSLVLLLQIHGQILILKNIKSDKKKEFAAIQGVSRAAY